MGRGIVKPIVMAALGTVLGVVVARSIGVYWAVGALAGLALGIAVDFLTARMGPRD